MATAVPDPPTPTFITDLNDIYNNDIDKKTMINAYLYFNNLIEDCSNELTNKLSIFLASYTNNLNYMYRKNSQRLLIMLIQKILTKKTISESNKSAVIEIINFLQAKYIDLATKISLIERSQNPEITITPPGIIDIHKSYIKFTISFIYYCLNNKKINGDPDAISFSEIFNAIDQPDLMVDELKMGVTIGQTGGLKKNNKKSIKTPPIKKDNKKSKEKSKKK